MDRQQQQQHIELACPSRGSLNDGARLVQMCPSLYLAACRGRPEEVMALLLQQHGAGRAGRYQATGNNCVLTCVISKPFSFASEISLL